MPRSPYGERRALCCSVSPFARVVRAALVSTLLFFRYGETQMVALSPDAVSASSLVPAHRFVAWPRGDYGLARRSRANITRHARKQKPHKIAEKQRFVLLLVRIQSLRLCALSNRCSRRRGDSIAHLSRPPSARSFRVEAKPKLWGAERLRAQSPRVG